MLLQLPITTSNITTQQTFMIVFYSFAFFVLFPLPIRRRSIALTHFFQMTAVLAELSAYESNVDSVVIPDAQNSMLKAFYPWLHKLVFCPRCFSLLTLLSIRRDYRFVVD